MESNEQKVIRKRQSNPDRIVLDAKSLELIKSISEQIDQSFGGIIKLSHKEIANFILESRAELLSGTELKAIKEIYFDDVRAAQWALAKLKAAKDKGESLTLTEILTKIQMSIVKEKRPSKTDAAKREKQASGETQAVVKGRNNKAIIEQKGLINNVGDISSNN